jgi:hypothetical protein
MGNVAQCLHVHSNCSHIFNVIFNVIFHVILSTLFHSCLMLTLCYTILTYYMTVLLGTCVLQLFHLWVLLVDECRWWNDQQPPQIGDPDVIKFGSFLGDASQGKLSLRQYKPYTWLLNVERWKTYGHSWNLCWCFVWNLHRFRHHVSIISVITSGYFTWRVLYQCIRLMGWINNEIGTSHTKCRNIAFCIILLHTPAVHLYPCIYPWESEK